MRYTFGALFLSVLCLSANAQTVSESVTVVNGKCDPRSGVTIDEGDLNEFSCDSAIIARTQKGTVLIQFTDKTGDDGRILGFAGTIEGKQGFGADATQMLAVERVYLAGGADPVPVSRGTCIINWSGLQRQGGAVTSVLCGARATVEGYDLQAVAVLEADAPTGK